MTQAVAIVVTVTVPEPDFTDAAYFALKAVRQTLGTEVTVSSPYGGSTTVSVADVQEISQALLSGRITIRATPAEEP